MSHRAHRTTQAHSTSRKLHNDKNQQILKTLAKQPANKSCADCKTGTNPRWAAWNLGIFICIRCSGIHRSMGTHISKVKSIDLDSWTDEQIQSMVDWGNAKANTYWEHNLPQNHVPDESKIQNFIRTKYELKKWVASKHIPDPSTIAAGDQLATVNNILVNKSPAKQALENHHDLLNGQAPLKHVPANLQSKPLPNPLATKENTPAKASLLDLNFGGPDVSSLTQPQQQQHPSINSGRTNRPDLKKSILALYSNSSSAPASNTQLPQPAGGLSNSLAGLNLGASPSGLAGSAPPSNVWNSSPNILDASASQKKSAADDDLFKNVWS